MSSNGLEAVSDGVLAIVVTLLILDVKVPSHAKGHLAQELDRQWPQYLAYLVSFLIVGIIWLTHHATVQLRARTDHGTQVRNLLLLLSVSVLPWPTAVLAEYAHSSSSADQRAAVLLYGVTSSCMALAFNILWCYLLGPPSYTAPASPASCSPYVTSATTSAWRSTRSPGVAVSAGRLQPPAGRCSPPAAAPTCDGRRPGQPDAVCPDPGQFARPG